MIVELCAVFCLRRSTMKDTAREIRAQMAAVTMPAMSAGGPFAVLFSGADEESPLKAEEVAVGFAPEEVGLEIVVGEVSLSSLNRLFEPQKSLSLPHSLI